MHIESVTAYAFGPFVDETLELAPGMNVIHGRNESGKSSWHAALYSGLCGVRRGRGQRKEERDFRDRHRPWVGGAWEVSAIVQLADGRRVELHHDLDGKINCWAHDAELGRDYSSEIIQKGDGAPDGARWLGLDRRSFLSTACVRQADIQSVIEQAGALQNELQRAAATAGTDSTASAALERLEDFRKENVGRDWRNSTRPLRSAKERHERAQQRLDDANRAHETYLAQLEEIEWQRGVKDDAEHSLRLVEAALAAAHAGRRETDARRARTLSEKYPVRPQSKSESSEVVGAVDGALALWDKRPSVVELQGQTAEELRSELGRLPSMPKGDTNSHESVVNAKEGYLLVRSTLYRHREGRPPSPPIIETGGLNAPQLHELAGELTLEGPSIHPQVEERVARARERIEKLGDAALAQSPRDSRRIPLILRPLLFLIRIILAPLKALLKGAHRGAAQAARIKILEERQRVEAELRDAEAQLGNVKYMLEDIRRRRNEAGDKTARHGLPTEPEKLAQLAQQIEQAEQASRDLRRWGDQEKQCKEELGEAEKLLCEALEKRGIVVVSSPVDALARYEKECSERDQVAKEASRRSDLEGAYEQRRHVESLAEDSTRRRREAVKELRAAAEAVGVTGDADDEIAARLMDWHHDYQKDLENLDRALGEWNELQGLLDGGTLMELEQDAAYNRRQAERLAVGLELEEVDGMRLESDVDAQLQRLRQTASYASNALAEKEGSIEQYSRTMPSVPEAEEEFESATVERRRVERLDRTLEITRILLEKAQNKVHRTVAPLLRDAVRPWLHRVTDGRYTDVLIDAESLLVRVSGDGRSWREVPLLSHGTAEQVYLLLRIAMARLLTRESEETCPLILDDVTVNCDPQRQAEMMDVLRIISEEQQVIVFSQEPETMRWAQEHLVEPRDRLVGLPLSEILA